MRRDNYEQRVRILPIPRDSTTPSGFHCLGVTQLNLFTGKLRHSFHTRPTFSRIVTCAFATQTRHDFDDVTTAYCLVLRATKYRDVMGMRV